MRMRSLFIYNCILIREKRNSFSFAEWWGQFTRLLNISDGEIGLIDSLPWRYFSSPARVEIVNRLSPA